MATKMPNELAVLRKETKALVLSTEFTVAKSANNDIPITVLDEKYSRFILTLIDTEDSTKAVTANIKAHKEASAFINRISYGVKECMPYLLGQKTSEGPSGKAYSQKLSGKLQGRVPAEFLDGDAAKYNLLKNHYLWLKDRTSDPKYGEGNRMQMAAIEEAMALYKAGKLESVKPSSIELYNSGPKPNVHKKMEDGFAPCQELIVTVTMTNNYPFNIEVENYEAPVDTKNSGAVNAVRSSKRNQAKHSFAVSVDDMQYLIDEMKRTLDAFRTVHFLECERDMQNVQKANRQAAAEKN